MFELYVDSGADMTPFSFGMRKTACTLIICGAVASCTTVPESAHNMAQASAPASYYATQVRDAELSGFAAYLSTLRNAQANGNDVAQLQHIQSRELGERVRVVATTSAPTTCIEMPMIAAVTPPAATGGPGFFSLTSGGTLIAHPIVYTGGFQQRMSSFRMC